MDDGVDYASAPASHDPVDAALQSAVDTTLAEARRRADAIIAEAVQHGLAIVSEAREKAKALDAGTRLEEVRGVGSRIVRGLDDAERRLSQRADKLVARLTDPDGAAPDVDDYDDEAGREGAFGPDAGEEAVEVSGPLTGTNGDGAHPGGPIQVGDLTLDDRALSARIGDREVAMTPVQAKILGVLMAHAGQVVHRSTLLQRVWGTDDPLFTVALERHVALLQGTVEDDPMNPTRITSAGSGYRYRAP